MSKAVVVLDKDYTILARQAVTEYLLNHVYDFEMERFNIYLKEGLYNLERTKDHE